MKLSSLLKCKIKTVEDEGLALDPIKISCSNAIWGTVAFQHQVFWTEMLLALAAQLTYQVVLAEQNCRKSAQCVTQRKTASA